MPNLTAEQQEKILWTMLDVDQAVIDRWKQTDTTMSAEMTEAAAKDGQIIMYGPIVPASFEGWWGEDESVIGPRGFRKALDAIEGDVLLRINSPGGDLATASAIRQAIGERREEGDAVDCIVEGLCASAAAFIAVTCDKVRMTEMSVFVVHGVRAWIRGTSKELRKMSDHFASLDSIQNGIYRKRTGKTKAEIDTYMDDEKYFTSEEAVEAGFADEVAEAVKAQVDGDGVEAILEDKEKALGDIFTMSTV